MFGWVQNHLTLVYAAHLEGDDDVPAADQAGMDEADEADVADVDNLVIETGRTRVQVDHVPSTDGEKRALLNRIARGLGLGLKRPLAPARTAPSVSQKRPRARAVPAGSPTSTVGSSPRTPPPPPPPQAPAADLFPSVQPILERAFDRAFTEPMTVTQANKTLVEQMPTAFTKEAFLRLYEDHQVFLVNWPWQVGKSPFQAVMGLLSMVNRRLPLMLMGLNSVLAVTGLRDKVSSQPPVVGTTMEGILYRLGLANNVATEMLCDDGVSMERRVVPNVRRGMPTMVLSLANKTQLQPILEAVERGDIRREDLDVYIDEGHILFDDGNGNKAVSDLLTRLLFTVDADGVRTLAVAHVFFISATGADLVAYLSRTSSVNINVARVRASPQRLQELNYFGLDNIRASVSADSAFTTEILCQDTHYGRDKDRRFSVVHPAREPSSSEQRARRDADAEERFLRDVTEAHFVPEVLDLLKDAARLNAEGIPTFVFEASKYKDAQGNTMTLSKSVLKSEDACCYSVTGASSDPKSFKWIRRAEDAFVNKDGTVDVTDPDNVIVEEFRSLEDMYRASAAHASTRMIYLCTNCGAGSITFVKSRPITHLILGAMTKQVDLNVVLQTVGRACFMGDKGPMPTDDNGHRIARLLCHPRELKVLLMSYINAFGNLAVSNTFADGVTYIDDTSDYDLRYLIENYRIGHRRANVAEVRSRCEYAPVEVFNLLGGTTDLRDIEPRRRPSR